ncbi:MarR family transcriptional regulator [Streptomyces sp. NBC_01460]|uniref:MarR family transcriptional regulator n=1 Tax=Streptomyces sp. NBC_01460 TaxID=2903875 RepID=UPI002E34912D|nr:MarR family transcriptional regulator [Streptomyces sp. NBC_01460]
MATEHLSPALRAPASSRPYAKARPGYGKRTASGQRASQAADFALMAERERYVAGYVDRLPDGAAMDIKSLAKSLPLYGQMAVSSALKALGVAGHLRRVRCLAGEGEQVRWVSRTYWSRTARDNEWWDTFLTTEGSHSTPRTTPTPTPGGAEGPVAAPTSPQRAPSTPTAPPEPTAPPAPPAPAPASPAMPEQRTSVTPEVAASPAYLALAQLGRRDPRLALSAADCRTLEPLAAIWFARGVDADYLTQALTAGLPAQVGSPVGIVRRRLTDKLPPYAAGSPAPATTVTPKRRVLAECTECGRPGSPEALPDGLCRLCRTTPQQASAAPPAERDVHALVGQLRELTRLP